MLFKFYKLYFIIRIVNPVEDVEEPKVMGKMSKNITKIVFKQLRKSTRNQGEIKIFILPLSQH